MITLCPYCGSEEVYFTGVDDGGGDYGDSVCDQYECQECFNDFEAHCIGEDELNDGAITDLTNTDSIEIPDCVKNFTQSGKGNVDDIPF